MHHRRLDYNSEDPFKAVNKRRLMNQLPDIPGSWKEKELVRDLLHDYEKKARPVVDGVSPIAQLSETLSVQQITIEFGLSLIQILELDENEQVLTTSIRTLYVSSSTQFKLSIVEVYKKLSLGLEILKIGKQKAALKYYLTPDPGEERDKHSADERLEERRRSDLLVSYTGTVEWQPLAIYKSACFVHIKYFPFDQQNCRFKFGPWTYDAARTNITFYNNSDGWFLNDYEESPEWELLATKAVFTGFKYQCCAEIYPDITFQLVIKRQPAFYNYVIILPCFLLSSLTLVLFCLPAETPAKMQLGMTMFQAFNFLLLILTQSIPSGASSFPLIGTYYCINMFLVTLSTFLCLIVVNCHYRGDSQSEVPRWAKKVFIEYGARLFFINSPSSHAAKANPASAKTNSTGGGGGGAGGGAGCNSGGSGWSRRTTDAALAEAAHADKMMRSAAGAAHRSTCQTPPAPMGRCHIRDVFRGGCSCEIGCHMGSGCCFATRQNPSYYPPGASLCLECQQQQQLNQQAVDTCCQQWSAHHTHHCQTPHAGSHTRASCSCEECNTSYREQEPPCRLPLSAYQRNAQPKSPFAEEETGTNQTCPACAGLAVAASQDCGLSDGSYNEAQCAPPLLKDPDAALADVWASAAHHRSGRSIAVIPSSVSRRSGCYNTENLLVECISGDGVCGGSQFSCIADCTQCQQCDAERYATGVGSKPDTRVLRRVATVTRDIAEIVRGIRYFQRKNEEKERVQKIINEWRTVGGVLDRLFFVCYIIAISISIILYFPRPAGSG
ncbi:unnamed protein product [Taenia asiatica]|uniref:Neur_chan_LBD domain-containing protein n=1 Tax=Taenia asiatica TaxID=60517 RepID=A0A158R7R1_TAEAS|nr:unnamed protein product [Taenia asiatica]